jgi:hypothetical protein
MADTGRSLLGYIENMGISDGSYICIAGVLIFNSIFLVMLV